MEILIKMSKGRYEEIMSGKNFVVYQCDIRDTLKKSRVLPEGHGDLKDVSRLKAEVFKASMDNHFMPIKPLSCDNVMEIIDNALTIVEADKEGRAE